MIARRTAPSPWPVSRLSLALEVAADRLTGDPVLSAEGGVRTWWFGTERDCDRPELTTDDLPAVLCSAELGPARPADDHGHYFPMVLRFEMYQRSLDVRDAFDFWAAIVNCLLPPYSNVVLNQLAKQGCINQTIAGPFPEVRTLDGGALAGYGVGTLELQMRFPT